MKKTNFFKTIILGGSVVLASCNTDNDLTQINSNVIGTPNYSIETMDIPLEINNIKTNSVQTSNLSSYHLGQITQGDFGTTNASIVTQVLLASANPIFGTLTQSKENETGSYTENETIKSVYLYLPFFSTSTTTSDATTYKLDSIFGSKTATFNVNVEELNYNLRTVDTNFGTQIYYSNQNTPAGEVLVSGASAKISNEAMVRYQFDDPTTSADESKNEKDKLSPGIRVELSNKAFFQTHLLDNEGKTALSNNTEFVKTIKGIIISANNFSQEVLALINLFGAKIEVNYTYNHKHTDGNFHTKTATIELTLATQTTVSNVTTRLGIALNKFDFKNENVTLSADNIYLKGGRYIAELTIPNAKIQELKSKKALINQAEIIFYLNENETSSYKLPNYLLLYNVQTGGRLADYTNELSTNTNSVVITSLEKLKTDNNGTYYKARINDHLISVLNGNTDNVKLGLVASLNNISGSMTSGKYLNVSNKEGFAPLGNSENLLHTIIHGNGTNTPEAKKLKLRVKYSTSK